METSDEYFLSIVVCVYSVYACAKDNTLKRCSHKLFSLVFFGCYCLEMDYSFSRNYAQQKKREENDNNDLTNIMIQLKLGDRNKRRNRVQTGRRGNKRDGEREKNQKDRIVLNRYIQIHKSVHTHK